MLVAGTIKAACPKAFVKPLWCSFTTACRAVLFFDELIPTTTFDSSSDLVVAPNFDPSKKGDNEHYRYSFVKLDKPNF
ncbi:hypothetical protein CR513_27691, partial [Mucuna pruriens]